MNPGTPLLSSLLNRLHSIGIFQRVFGWNKIRQELAEAAAEWNRQLAARENLDQQKNELARQLADSQKDLALLIDQKARMEEGQKRQSDMLIEAHSKHSALHGQLVACETNFRNAEKKIAELTREMDMTAQKKEEWQQRFAALNEEYIRLREKEEARMKQHVSAMDTLHAITTQVQSERTAETNLRQQQEIDRILRLKQTWVDHQSAVKNSIKAICNKHAVEYIEQVPFRGEPDNTIRICDEYIVFDAKSPAGDDASGFYSYLKEQAEKAKKYAKQENVRADVFLVVPANVLDVVKQTTLHLADYTVFIISADCLEPVILGLKKIEAYEFAQQMSPEERENICRVIGKFAHLSKRRIQIDSFFAKQFIELVYKCESSLPDDILEKVAEFERAEKLNPPMEKRAKSISTAQLDIEITQLQSDAENKGIQAADLSAELNGVQLYRHDASCNG